jgi:hypothetical protein
MQGVPKAQLGATKQEKEKESMDKHILNISGKRSTAFMGKEIAAATNRGSSEETEFDWDTVRVFRVDPEWARQQQAKTGKVIDPYRVGIAKCTIWEGERDRYRVFYARTLQQVNGIVRTNLPQFEREISDKLRLNTVTPPRQLQHERGRGQVVS